MAAEPAAPAAHDPLAWFRRHALLVAVLGWAAFYGVNAAMQTATLGIEAAREPGGPAPWQITTWEWSSALAFYLLVPLVGRAEARFPLVWSALGKHLVAHVGISLIYSALHVGLMVAMREAVYAAAGSDYRFGALPSEALYEYLKDWRSYAVALTILHFARLLLRRSQGEASIPEPMPSAGDPAASAAAARRPERFLVRKLGKDFLVPAADIEFAVASGNYVNLRVRGRDYPLRSTLAALESELDPTRFARVHRGVIVNLDHVAHIEPLESGDARIAMSDGTTVPCSRRMRPNLAR